MSAFENGTRFFHACESLEGWAGCQQYVADGATFTAQSEPIADLSSVEAYCEWMAGLGSTALKGCGYDLHSSSWDETNKTALFFATFNGQHVGEGGPVPPTNQETHSHYVYALKMDDQGKVSKMAKIWNAPWALRELGWG
jgi:hypothetical protein